MREPGFDSLAADEDGGREVFHSPSFRKPAAESDPASLRKIYPVASKAAGSSDNNLAKGPRSSRAKTKQVIFQVAIAVVACICLGWTLWLILLNVAPNETINRVMKTETFDYGSFWLMVDPPKTMMVAATIGLFVVTLGYLSVLVAILPFKRKQRYDAAPVHRGSHVLAEKMGKALNEAAEDRTGSKVTASAAKMVVALTHEESAARKRMKLLMKFGDLALETFLLVQMLESGSPTPLIAFFTSVVLFNAVSCAAVMFVPYERAPLAEIFIDVAIDFFIAIGCPMLVVLYCLSAFTFDRTKFAINMKVYPSGWFEQNASVNADPVEIAVIYKSLKSLRIMTAFELLARVGVNVMFSLRLRYIVELSRRPRRLRSSVYPKRHRLGAIGLVLYALILVIFVEESMRTSTRACQPHPECAVNAHRWTILKDDALTQCPCLMMIDRDIAPKTFEEWIMPRNVTDKVVQLASTGDLQMLQLTNRYLGELPVELRRCKNLRHLSLEYTNTQTFPPWVKEFSKLEFLHVESKVTSPMVFLPDDIFDDMSSLTFLHLAMLLPITHMPSLQGLTGLKSITLAVFLSLQELPPLTSLHKLERLVLAGLVSLDSLPDLTPVRNLKSFVVSDRGTWCCNGFLGDCDLSNDKCMVHPVWGTPVATCLPSNRTEKVATPATLELVRKFAPTVCGPVLRPGVLEGPPTPDIMAPCNGTMYRQCLRSDNIESICYNARFMGIACTTNPFPIMMRRLQIAEGVGDKCNPEFEAWLGCK